jgi:hypothetical protein
VSEFIFLGVLLLTLLGSTTSNKDEARTTFQVTGKVQAQVQAQARASKTRQDIQHVGTEMRGESSAFLQASFFPFSSRIAFPGSTADQITTWLSFFGIASNDSQWRYSQGLS